MKPDNEIAAELVIAALILAGEIRSTNYVAGVPFAVAGTRIDLLDGDIDSTAIKVDGATGALSVRGTVTCTALTILYPPDGSTAAVMEAGASSSRELRMYAPNSSVVGSLRWQGPAAATRQVSISLDGTTSILQLQTGNASLQVNAGGSLVLGGSTAATELFAGGAQTVRIRPVVGGLAELGDTAAGGSYVRVAYAGAVDLSTALGSINLTAVDDVTLNASDDIVLTAADVIALNPGTQINYNRTLVSTRGNAVYWMVDSADVDTGLFYIANDRVALVGGGSLVLETSFGVGVYLNDFALRLRSTPDGNHELKYTAATPTGSGLASNGPRLQGFTSVWLKTVNADKNLFLVEPSGNVFINAGAAYTNFSSRRLKRNVRPLDPADCLATVRRWRPVSFDWLAELAAPHEHDEGFIAEDHARVSPSMTGSSNPDAEPDAIDYSRAVVRLTGAVQELDRRLSALGA